MEQPQQGASARDRDLVDAFVRRHFSLRGTLRLHRQALGWDLLRAPANVMLAPVFLGLRVSGLVFHALRLRRASRWVALRQITFRSDIGRRIEDDLLAEVILPRTAGPFALTPEQRRLIGDYATVRTAIAETVTTLVVLSAGFAAFHAATPGVLSLAPVISDHAAHAQELARFPLGEGAGRLWYAVFPGERPVWHVAAIGAGLVVVLSLVTTFAGILADPVQTALGIHRRRLLRLLANFDDAAAQPPGIAREHVIARAGDLADLGATLLKILKN